MFSGNSECRSTCAADSTVQYGCRHVLICCVFKTRQWDESLRYVSEPVVMYSITPSIVMQKIKILNCRKKKIIFNLEKNLKNASKYGCNKRMRALLLHGDDAAWCCCCMLLLLLLLLLLLPLLLLLLLLLQHFFSI